MESVDGYEYNAKDLIGHGAFAVVFRGRSKTRSDQVVAIKNISKKNLTKSQPFPDKEIEILKELHHQNVVALLHFKETPTSLFMVMEYCNGGDLADYLHVKGTLSEDTIRFFFRQIAAAMKTLHAKGIIHRDLKPQNLLLSYRGRGKPPPPPSEIIIKIADFGFARFLEEDNMAATLCGSPLYMAPEVITSQQYTAKADLWSVGTIIYQCLTGKAPFKASNPQALKKFYQTAKSVEPHILPGTSKHMTDLLTRLLKRNQKDRIEFDDFFNHLFLAKSVQSTSSTSPLPVPSRPSSYSSDSPEGPMSVSPVMAPISSPEDVHVLSPQAKVGSSPELNPTKSPKLRTIIEKREMVASGGGIFDHEEVEGDFVLVCTTRPSVLATSGSPSSHGRTVGSTSPVVAFSKAMARPSGAGDVDSPNGSTPSPNDRPSSLPLSPETFLQFPNQRTPSKMLPKSPSSALVPSVLHRTSPQMRSKVPSPTPGTTLTSPGSFISSGVLTRVNYRTSPSPPLSINKDSSLSPVESGSLPLGYLYRTSPPLKRDPESTPTRSAKSPARRKLSSPAKITTLQCPSPTSLPAIMASPANPELSYTSTTSPSEPLNMPFVSAGISRRTRTYSDLTDDSCGSGSDSNSFRRSVSVSRLTDQNSLRTAFETLARTPSASLEGLPGSCLATTPPTFPTFYIGGSGCPSRSQSRRSSSFLDGSPSSQGSITFAASPPNMEGPIAFIAPELPEETLMAPEHTETVERLNIMYGIVEAIIELAKSRKEPLSESVYLKDVTGIAGASQICFVSESQRHAEQMVLYSRAMELLTAALNLAKDELMKESLKNSKAVRKILAQLHSLYGSCFDQCSMLHSRTLIQSSTESASSGITADRLMYVHALELCQSSGFEEMCGNLEECISRYHTAQMLLHGLCLQAKALKDREQLLKLKLALDQRLLHLDKQVHLSPYTPFT